MLMSKISPLSLISFIVIITTLNFAEGYNVANALVQSFPQNSKVAPSLPGIPFQNFQETPSHVVRYGLTSGQFSEHVDELSSTYSLSESTKTFILDGMYAEVNKEVIREFNFKRGGPGNVIHGRIATIKRSDGTIDLAQAIHKVDFKLQPEIIHHDRKRRILGIVVRVERWKEERPRSISEADQNRLHSYAQYKALFGFSGSFGNHISGACQSSNC